MACACCAPALRYLIGCQGRSLRASNQRRWAQVHDVRFLATTQPRRSVLEKYRDKLDAKARQEGHADIDQLRKAYAGKIERFRLHDAKLPSPAPPPPSESPSPPSSATLSSAAATAAKKNAAGTPAARPLSAILDLPKARALPLAELSAVWRLRHAADGNSLCAVIPAATYAAMETLARAHPQFVLPVPHPGRGAEMHFLQWAFDDGGGGGASSTTTTTVLFTQLAEYKLRGEFAQPHTTITHHLDLRDDKGVVLMHGQTADGRGVSADNARWLVMCLQRFYGGWDGDGPAKDEGGQALQRAAERRRLLQWFATGDERFTVEKLLEEAERL